MDTETGQGFIRQRRNLISISLVLLFYQVLGLEIKTLNIFGTTIDIQKNSPYVVLILWIMCVYFLIRYYQYYNHINIGEVKNKIQSRMHEYVGKTAFKIFKQTYDPSKDADGRTPPYEVKFYTAEILKESTAGWNIKLGVLILSNSIPTSEIRNYPVVVKRKNLIWPFLKSRINIAFTTRFVTEYYLPFLLALIPIATQIILWIILFHKETGK